MAHKIDLGAKGRAAKTAVLTQTEQTVEKPAPKRRTKAKADAQAS